MSESKVPPEWRDAHGRVHFTMHNVAVYRDMAQEECYSDWLRCWFFAVSAVAANGHACLRQGALAYALGTRVDEVWERARPDTVKRAIARAKDKRLLDPRSRALCLIPNGQIVVQGQGDPNAKCPRHDKDSRVRHLWRVS